MAKRGRFAQQTGGSNLSALIYDIMRAQYSRTVNSLLAAYKNQTDYRGQGVPSSEDVISYLQTYAANNWVSQADRDEISLDIADVQRIESGRRETVMINAINENPGDANAIQTYIDFLNENIASAQTGAIAAESRDKLFAASKSLLNALGKSLGDGAISVQDYDSRAAQIVNSYSEGTPNRREMMSTAASAKFTAQYNVQNTLLATAAGQGIGAYYRQLQQFKRFLIGARQAVVSAGLGTVNSNGNIIAGSAVALDIQSKLGDVNSKLESAGKNARLQVAADRINRINENSAGFLGLVNQTLGSNYASLEDFAKNQIDVQRFYAVSPGSVSASKDFIDKTSFMHIMFSDNNSILAARKELSETSDSAMAAYSDIVNTSKNYGRKTLVDDAAILFADWFRTTGSSRGDTIINTQKAESIVNKYADLIEKQGNAISPEELAVHQYTLSLMQSALQGNVVEVDRPTAWDLANPDAAQYDTATSKYTSVFSGTLQLIANDAADSKNIKAGYLPVATIAPDGKLQYSGSVNPEDKASNVVPIIDTSTGRSRLVAMSGTDLVSPSAVDPNKYDPQGRVYNLGNGNFVVQDAKGGFYERNFDPFSNKTMTFSDFKNRYTQRTTTTASTGETQVTQTPQFVVSNDVTAFGGDSRPEPSSDLTRTITSNVDARIADLRSNTSMTPDSIDRSIGATVWGAFEATRGTIYEPEIRNKYADIQLPSLNPGTGKVGSLAASPELQASYNAYRAGERGDRLTAVAFRNTPAIASIFTNPNSAVNSATRTLSNTMRKV